MGRIHIGVIQSKVYPDAMENIWRIRKSIQKSTFDHIDFLVLPEMFCCPYDNDQFAVYAEKEGQSMWKACQLLAREKGVYLIAGSMPECDSDGKIYNTSYVFDRLGNQIAKHRKAHLFDIDVEGGQSFKESKTLSAGNRATVFETEYGKMGLCICYDIRFPEFFRRMAEDGAQIIFVPAAFNMTTGPRHWELLFRSRAVDYQVFTAGCASARDKDSSYQSFGHSIVVDPFGEICMEMDETEDARVVEIDLDRIKAIRAQLPLWKQRRMGLYI